MSPPIRLALCVSKSDGEITERPMICRLNPLAKRSTCASIRSTMSALLAWGTWQYPQAVCLPAGARAASNSDGWVINTNGRSAGESRQAARSD